jgi:S1-C subfamily serine protease
MLQRSYLLTLLTFVSLIFVLALAACTQDLTSNNHDPSRSAVEAESATTQTMPTPIASSQESVPIQETLSTVEIARRLAPSVVQIVTETLTAGLFNQPVPSRGVGTGIILDQEGHILTNNHVVAGAENIMVILGNGESFPAELVGGDPSTDTAVIRINAQGLQPAVLGSSSELQVGEEVVAIGHALGLGGGPTVTQGVISALSRSIDSDPQTIITDLIQTDAAINPGNSGGPLVNSRGEVIGINTAIISGSQGIGFAININDARVVAAQLIEQGFVSRGFLGIAPVNLSPSLANLVGVPVTEGVLIAQVAPDSPADEAGLREEDVIVEMNGQPIRNTGELSQFLLEHPPSEAVSVRFFRAGQEQTTEVVLGERPGGP